MPGMRYQPQGLTRLSASPLTKGLRLAINGAGSVFKPAVGPDINALGGPTSGVSGFGRVIEFNGANQALSIPIDLSNTQAVTVISLMDLKAAAGVVWEYGTDTVGNRRGFDAYHGNGQLQVWMGMNGTGRYGQMYIPFTGQRVLGAVYDSTQAVGAQVAMYLDGVLQTRITNVNTSAIRNTYFTNETLHISSRTGTASWVNTGIALFLVFDRALSSEEIASISNNPWQLFAEPEHDDYLAALAASYSLSVGAAQMAAAGGQVGMRVSRKLAVAPAALTLATSGVALRASRRLGVLPAAMSVAGGDAALRVSRRLSVAPAAMVMTGGQVSMSYAPNPEIGSYTLPVSSAAMTLTGGNIGMRVTRRLRVGPASLVMTGGAVRTLVGRRLMVSPAGLQLVGGSVTLRFSARGEPFDISKIHPSRLVIFEGSGSSITLFEGSGSRITPFEGSGSRITRFE